MHFIVTGAAGFIGSHVTEELLAAGHSITAIDNLTTGCRENLPQHPHLTLLHKNILNCQPEDFSGQIDGIAHLAAIPSVMESWWNPLATHHHNLSAMVAVIQLCQSLGIPRLVFASSAAVYGGQTALPIAETQDTLPISPYGLQKLASEQYARLFAQQLGFSFVALRLFNVFGPRQRPNSPYSGVISIFEAAMQDHQPITIYGDGSQTRDFIYVKDVAIAFAQSLTSPISSGCNLTCNVGTGKSISLQQLVGILQGCFPDWSAEVRYAPARTGDILHSQADISQARRHLSFRPQWSVQAGMKRFVESHCPSLHAS